MKAICLVFSALALFIGQIMHGQTASVQFIHNSADYGLPQVDIYIDQVLMVEGLEYRSASLILEVPGGTLFSIQITNTGAPMETAFFETNVIFAENDNYVATLLGMDASTGYTPLQPFELAIQGQALWTGDNPAEVDLLFAHGCTDLPGVRLVDASNNEWAPTFYFGDYQSSYYTAPAENVLLDLRDISNNTIAQFQLPFMDYGLSGPMVAALSGFNNPNDNFLGTEVGIWLAFPEGGPMIECPQYIPPVFTSAQIIHASADPSMQRVDIYIGNELYIDNLEYLHATPFMDIQALVDVELLVAPDTSLSADEAFSSLVVNLLPDANYVLTIAGNFQSDGFAPNVSLSVAAYQPAIYTTQPDASVNVLFVNASTDAPVMDIQETELLMLPLAEDFSFGNYAGYFEFFVADYVFALSDPQTEEIWAAYSAPFTSYSLGSTAATIVAAGYTNTIANQNGSPYGLYLSLTGGGALIPLPMVQAPAQAHVQLIHNAPDTAIESIDIYLNGARIADDLAFRSATNFLQVPISASNTITVVPGDAWNADGGVSQNFTWVDGQRISLAVGGLWDGTGYNPNVPMAITGMDVTNATTAPGSVSCYLVNGSTDGPSFALQTANNGSDLCLVLDYLQSSAEWSIASNDMVLDVINQNDQIISSYVLPAATWFLDNTNGVVLSSGFFAPNQNNNGPAFGLWFASAAGGALMELPEEIIPTYIARMQLIHNAPDSELEIIDVYANGALIADDLNFREASSFMDIPAQVPVLFAVAPADSDGPQDAVAFVEQTFASNSTNYVILHGVLNTALYNPAQTFGVTVFDAARESAININQTDLIFFHGAMDMPALDASEITVPMLGIMDNLMYDGFGGYLALDAASDYAIEMYAADVIALGQFALPVSANDWAGEALLIFASGFLNPANNNDGPIWQLYAVFPDGNTMPLSPYVHVMEQQEAAQIQVYPNPTNQQLTWTGVFKEAQNLEVELIDVNGKVVFSDRNLQCGKTMTQSMDVSHLPEGYYFLRIQNRQLVETIGFGIIR